jgi:hypothetical protein
MLPYDLYFFSSACVNVADIYHPVSFQGLEEWVAALGTYQNYLGTL